MTRSLAPLAAAALLCCGFARAASPVYHIKELGLTPNAWASEAVAINDGNIVVGWLQQEQNGPQVAAVWQADGSVKTIGTLPGVDSSFATGVNTIGQVVGYAGPYNQPQAFLWDAVNGMQAIGGLDPANTSSMATGISDDATVVGHSLTPAGASHAFTWTAAGGMIDPFPSSASAEANAINAKDQWVGDVLSPKSAVAVRVSPDGTTKKLGFLTSYNRHAYGRAVNNLGMVVGMSGTPTYSNHAFLWDKVHGIQDLGALQGGSLSNGLGINDAGQVVGVSQDAVTVSAPFYWDHDLGMVHLTDLIADDDPLKASIQFGAARAINSQGVIVANGTIKLPNDPTPHYSAFLLIPQ